MQREYERTSGPITESEEIARAIAAIAEEFDLFLIAPESAALALQNAEVARALIDDLGPDVQGSIALAVGHLADAMCLVLSGSPFAGGKRK